MFFYSLDPIKVFLTEKSSTKLDENTFVKEFLLKAENTLGFEFNSAKISVPLPVSENVTEITVFDSFSGIKFEKENERIVFSSSFQKFQPKEFALKLKITDLTEFISGLKKGILSDLSFLSFSENNEIAVNAQNLSGKVSSAELNELIELRQKTDELLEKEKNNNENELILMKKEVQEKIRFVEQNIEFLFSSGLEPEAKKMQADLEKQKTALIDSSFLPEEDALKSLYKINSFLQEISDKNAEQLLLEKRDEIIKNAGLFSDEIILLEEKTISGKQAELLEEDNAFLGFYSDKNYSAASFSLKKMQENLDLIRDSVEQQTLSKFNSLKEKQSFLEEKKSSIKLLFPEILNALAESKVYVAPITQKRIDFLEKELNEISFSFNPDLNSLNELIIEEKALSEKESKINATEHELVFSLEKMKEDAKVFLLSAKLAGTTENTVLAEKLFSEGKFVESINASVLSSSQTGFFALNFLDIPLQVYPLIMVIAGTLFLKFRKKKKKTRKKKMIASIKD